MTPIISSCRILIAFNFLFLVASTDPDINRTGQELITSKGFPLEEHFVTTSDGYILRLFRFHNPNISAPVNSQKPPILLQHGLLCSSDSWIVNYRKLSFGFILADDGFDVWMGNNRGNKYSRNHTEFNPNPPRNEKFWNFSYDQLAMYDLPTQVNYVRTVTGVSKIPYVGHSQGTSQMFANLAQPKFFPSDSSVADSVSIYIALAPVTYIHHTTSELLKSVVGFHLDQLVTLLGDHEFLPAREIFEKLLPGICGPLPGICDAVIQAIAGYNPKNLDNDRLPVFVGHFPSGTSMKSLDHYAEGIRNDSFLMYNYATAKRNEQHYGQTTAPPYTLSTTRKVPMAIFYGGLDTMGDVEDCEHMLHELPGSNVVHVEQYPGMAHMDFVWGQTNAGLYSTIIDLVKQYT